MTIVRPAALFLAAVLGAALTLIGAVSPVGGVPAPTAAASDGLDQQLDRDQEVDLDAEVVLDQGHVDMGPKFLDGAFTLMVHDDTALEGSVWRPLDKVAVRIVDAAVLTVPNDPAYEFLGVEAGAAVHVVPQTQDEQVVWLGWNTQDPEVMQTVDRGVSLALTAVDGPGDLVVYLQDGGFGAPDVLWDSRVLDEQPLYVDVNTHTHANWVFTEPGLYRVGIRATATLLDGTEQSTLGTVRFAVGDDTSGQDALRAASLVVPADSETGQDGDPEPTATALEDETGVSAIACLVAASGVLAVLVLVVVLRGRQVRAQAREGVR